MYAIKDYLGYINIPLIDAHGKKKFNIKFFPIIYIIPSIMWSYKI